MKPIPCGSRQIDLPSSRSEWIVRCVNYPSVIIRSCIYRLSYSLQILLGILFERLAHSIEIVEHRQMAFRKIANLGQPVYHLEIYVAMIVVSPWCRYHSVPNALQSGRQTAGTRSLNHKIASESENQFLKSVVRVRLTVSSQTFRCGQ